MGNLELLGKIYCAKTKNPGLGMDIQNSCAKFQALSLKNGVEIWDFCAEKCVISVVAFNYLVSLWEQLWAINLT